MTQCLQNCVMVARTLTSPVWTGWVLVVEDGADDRYYLSKVLAYYGLAVRLAANGAEALEQLRGEPPILILTDLRMPQVDGWELLRHIRANPATAKVPVVGLTAEHSCWLEEQALQHGFNGFMEKPVRHQGLMRRLCGILGEPDVGGCLTNVSRGAT